MLPGDKGYDSNVFGDGPWCCSDRGPVEPPVDALDHSRVLFEELRRWFRDVSGVARSDGRRVEVGAITFVHRGGRSLNLNVHLRVVVADGV